MKNVLASRISFVLAAALCACGLQACYVDSNCLERTEYSCGVSCGTVCSPVCHTESVCESSCSTVCDAFYCWDECVDVCNPYDVCVDECWQDCAEHCHPYTVCEEPPECWTDRDCGANATCRGGVCEYYGGGGYTPAPNPQGGQSSQRGSVAMCGLCNRSGDCYEDGAACTLLDSGEQVCTRACETFADCPSGYSCVVVSDNSVSQSVQQCIPANNSCSTSYCNSDADCFENGICDNHSCVLSQNNLSECNTYQDCIDAGYKSNIDGAALNICIQYTDTSNNKANYCTIDCYTDRECDSGYFCYLSENNLDSGICFRGNELACTRDEDCSGKGMVCNNGRCSVSCFQDADCNAKNANFRCLNKVCIFDNYK